MSLFDEIKDVGVSSKSTAPIQEMAKRFKLPEKDIDKARREVIPAITGGMQKNIQDKDEALDQLFDAIEKGKHEHYLERPEELGRQEAVDDGNKILGHVFGNKEVSREVAKQTEQRTGVSSTVVKAMLPIVAGLAMAALKRRAGRGGMLGMKRKQRRTTGLSQLQDMLRADGNSSFIGDLLRRR